MPSLEEQFYLENPTRWQVLKRNTRLLKMLAAYAWMWLTRGRKVRQAYHEAQQSGVPLDLDELMGD